MNITIKHCNNVDEATTEVHPNTLNIKYGINGTGKTTIAKAIELAVTKDERLKDLLQFKYVGKLPSEIKPPSIQGLESVNSICVFNERYVNQFLFQKDEVVNNSFEIFIKTKDYEEKMREIDKLVSSIKQTLRNDETIEKVYKDLIELSESIGKPTKAGSLSGTSKFSKAFAKGNPLENIPEHLSSYEPFLKTEDNYKWVKWHMEGNNFMEVNDNCPYCNLPIAQKKETILSVSKEYQSKTVEHLNGLMETIENLGGYFCKESKINIEKVVKNKDGLSEAQKNFITEVRGQIDTLKNCLSNARDISYFSFTADDIEKEIRLLRIELSLFPHLKSELTKSIVDKVNNSLESVLTNIGKLKIEINKQRGAITRAISKNKVGINEFLKYAGYNYFVDIEAADKSFKMTLKHSDYKAAIVNSANHLSFGEKNAFALVLFMYECLSKNPDLVILDDPISSFDKNKKYAIIEKLFHGKESLKEQTTIMLSHDFEPIVDMLKVLHRSFQPAPRAYFLSNSYGKLKEAEIKPSDVMTFSQVCQKNIDENKSEIIKCIYLRRYYEILNNKGGLEYHLLSSLVHKKMKPTLDAKDQIKMPSEDIEKATKEIHSFIPNFDYNEFLKQVTDNKIMRSLYEQAANNYEKLQIFRIMNPYDTHEIGVIKKFINETFHIENEYVMQLDPNKYDTIPNYIIEECENYLENQEELSARAKA